MRVVIGAGGTGGHLYPALALVEYIKEQEPDSEFLFVGTLDRLESQVVPKLGYRYVGLNVSGMVGNPFKKAVAAMKFLKSIGTAKKVLKEFKPDIVLGFGGYPSASVVKGANSLKIKTLIHEQNSIIGLTNKILIDKVDKIVCCYNKALEELPKDKTLLLGNPRASVVAKIKPQDIHQKYNLDPSKKLVTIVMGSLGSKSVNDVVIKALNELEAKPYQVLYCTGKNYYDDFKDIRDTLSNVKIVPYIDDMPSVLNNSDLIISRAGASTIAEITSIGVPSILVPSPYVAANHQEYNANELVVREAAKVILEKDLSSNKLIEEIDAIINNDILLESLKTHAKAIGKPNACEDIYQLIKNMLGE